MRFWAGALIALSRRPDLWPSALVQARRFVPTGWWRRSPFLPLPDRGYLRYRMRTQYGDTGDPDPDDVVTYLTWCRSFGRDRGKRRWRSAGRR